MKNLLNNLGVVQNLGWIDRSLRFSCAIAMIGIPCFLLLNQPVAQAWYFYLILLSVYPALTAIMGYDMLYNLVGVKSCGTSERNPCGTFPFEIDAAIGHHPIPDSQSEHSLATAHHQKHLNAV